MESNIKKNVYRTKNIIYLLNQNNMNINKKYFNGNLTFLYALGIILISRFLPHPPNFTPIISLAILMPIFFKKDQISLILIISGMFITDIFLGFYSTFIITYLTLILIFYFNKIFLKNINFKNLIFTSLISSVIFFILTNFGVWAFGNMYEKNMMGLFNCYYLAIPFFHNTVLSTTLFCLISYFSYIKIKSFA